MFASLQNFILKIKNRGEKEFLYVIVFGLVYLAWNYRAFFIPPGLGRGVPSLDTSWVIGLNWASFLGLKWSGNSMVFTYGPLHYLYGLMMPQFYSDRMVVLINIGLNLFYTACFTYIYSLFAHLHKSKWIVVVIVIILLFFEKPDISLVPLFTAFIFLPAIFLDSAKAIKRYIHYGIGTLLLAIIPFIKFGHIYEAVLFVSIMIVLTIYKRRYLDGVIVGLLFVLFTILTWVLSTGEDVLSFFPYLAARFSISSGYSEAMIRNFSEDKAFPIFILALLFLAFLGIVFVYMLLTKQWVWAMTWLFPSITVFFAFKSAFVRADGHVMSFLGYIPLSGLYCFYLLAIMDVPSLDELRLSWRQAVAQTLTPIFVLFVLCAFSFSGRSFFLVNNEGDTFIHMSKLDHYTQAMDQTALKKAYNLDPKFLSQIDPQKTTDIIPWEIPLLYGYGLKWKPRPVIQSYASYTSKLDDLDADFFGQSDAPDQVIFSLFTIGNRYAPFDTPHTFRTLLDHYEIVAKTDNGRYSLLKKRKEPLQYDLVLIAQNEYNINKPIPIPQIHDGHLFMAAEITPTLLGNFLNLAYKPTIWNVEIKLNTGETIKYRLIRDTAKNGLFVSKRIVNLDDLSSVFNETYKQDIVSLRFIGDPLLYNSLIKIDFYKVPFH